MIDSNIPTDLSFFDFPITVSTPNANQSTTPNQIDQASLERLWQMLTLSPIGALIGRVMAANLQMPVGQPSPTLQDSFHPYMGPPIQGNEGSPLPGDTGVPAKGGHSNSTYTIDPGAHSTPPNNGPSPLQQALDALAKAQGDYRSAGEAVYGEAPPQVHQPTLTTKDLSWGVPALVGLLSGPNGRQLAAGLVQGGLQGNPSANDAFNQQRMAQWQFQQQRRANAVGVAAKDVEQAQQAVAARRAELAQSAVLPSGVPEFSGTGTGTKGVAPLPDFYGRYDPATIAKTRQDISTVANKSGVPPDVLISLVSPYPLETQAKLAAEIAGTVFKNPV
ncbi:MAG: hypothetical protein ACHQ50_01765 [Fimbriimonadales bacterium]